MSAQKSGKPELRRHLISGALLEDVRFAVRALARRPLYAAAAILTLGLGVGVNTAVFTIVDTLWLRPRPVSEPSRLGVLYREAGQAGDRFLSDRLPYGETYRLNDVPALSGIALELLADGASGEFRPRISLGLTPLRVAAVSHNYFSVLGIPVQGRAFQSGDDVPGAPPVAVVSDAAWRTYFRRDPSVIGREIRLDSGRELVVVGVAPRGFGGPFVGDNADIWIPLGAVPRFAPFGRDDAMVIAPVRVLGRLQPGGGMRQVEAHLADLLGTRVRLATLAQARYPLGREALMIRDKQLITLLGATVMVVLVIACVNLATLLLARSEERRHEIAVRRVLGVDRPGLVRLLLVEAGLLGVAGTLTALVVCGWFISGLSQVSLPSGLSIGELGPILDWRVALFSALASMATCLAAGLAPAWRASGRELSGCLASSSGSGHRTSPARSGLLAAHVALSVVLLVVASLFVRSVHRATSMDLGFDADHTIEVLIQPAISQYADADGNFDEGQRRHDVARALRRIRSLPGVRAATLGSLPLRDQQASARALTAETDGGRQRLSASVEAVGPGYLGVVGIACVAGRDLRESDLQPGAAPVVVVSRRFATRLWGAQPAVGKRVSLGNRPNAEVVGVAADAVRPGIRSGIMPAAYLPEDVLGDSPRFMFDLVVRTAGRPDGVANQIEDLVHQVFPEATQVIVRTARVVVATQMASERLGASVFSWFGLAALGLCLLDTYGLVSYLVARRTRESAIKLALGATPTGLVWEMILLVLARVAVGGLMGLVLAAIGSSILESYLFGISAWDPVSFLGVPLLLLLAACGANVLGAGRLRGLNAAEMLRSQ